MAGTNTLAEDKEDWVFLQIHFFQHSLIFVSKAAIGQNILDTCARKQLS